MGREWSTLMLWMSDDLTQAVAQAELTADGSVLEPSVGAPRPSSRYISYQPFRTLTGRLGALLKDEVWSEANRSSAVPNRIMVIDDMLGSNTLARRFSYFDALRIENRTLLVEAHTIYPQPATATYRVFYSVFGTQEAGAVRYGSPVVRTAVCDEQLLTCANDSQILDDGWTLGLVVPCPQTRCGEPLVRPW